MKLSKQTFRDGKWWIVFSALLLLGTMATYYGAYARRRVTGASGGSFWGLVYGFTGTTLIVFAFLLMAKKTWRTARVGPAYQWLQGHVWFGLVSYPIILYHAGGRFGGPLTWWLMVSFTIVWVSGIIGLAIQNILPGILLNEVHDETIYAQIDRVDRENLKQARKLVRRRVAVLAVQGYGFRGNGEAGGAAVATGGGDEGAGSAAGDALLEFYEDRVRPYLAHGLMPSPETYWRLAPPKGYPKWLGPTKSLDRDPPPTSAFAAMRSRYPSLFDEVTALEGFVAQRKHHLRQKRLHWYLHGWLLIHVPFSIVMMLLIPLHAVLAWRY